MEKSQRLGSLDSLRGMALVSMVLYHGMWDLAYSFSWDLPWFEGTIGMLWQSITGWLFIFLSGFCWQLGRHPGKRGLTVLGAGCLLTLVTLVVMPELPIYFGILTLLGSCMLLLIPLHRILRDWNPRWGLAVNLAVFLIGLGAATVYFADPGIWIRKIPQSWAVRWGLAYLGFPQPGFTSGDYYPLFPWFFLFTAGYFAQTLWGKREILGRGEVPVLGWLGRHSLLVYLLHQPILYGIFGLAAWIL